MVGDAVLENNPLWVIDVGASGGVDPRWGAFTSVYKGVLFEPDPREYDILKAKSKNNLVVLNSALSDSSCDVVFHLCEKQQVSSVYLPNVDFLRRFPDVKRYGVIRDACVAADTLSSQLKKNNIAEIDFIKIDTQGHELSILKGGVDYLDNVIGLEIEVEFSPLYRGQPLFGDVDSFVRGYGFELFDIKRYFWKRKDGVDTVGQKGQLVFGDALYFKSPEQILLIAGITPEKIIRSICVYLVYGYLDLAQTLFAKAHCKGLLAKDAQSKVVQLLAKHKRKNALPNFRGKRRIQRLFERIAKVFNSYDGWCCGTDEVLGNPWQD